MRSLPATGAVQRRITRVGRVSRVSARGIQRCPTDRWVGKFVAALPGVFFVARQQLKMNGLCRLVVSAPAELPGDLFQRFCCFLRVAAVDEFERIGHFINRGLATECLAEQPLDTSYVRGCRIGFVAVGFLAPCRQVTRLFDRKGAVHEEQRLLRNCSLGPIRRVIVRICEIERAEERGQILAFDETVHAATSGERRIDDRNRRPAHFVVESAGGDEQRITQRLEIESAAVRSPQETILGIGGYAFRSRFARLAIGSGKNNAADEMFCRPTVVHEVTRQCIEQFGVSRRRAADAEVARCIDQTFTKEMVPDAIHPHASGERVFAVGDVVGKFEPTAAMLERFWFVVGRKRREESSLGVRTAVARAATQENVRIVRFSGVRHFGWPIIVRLFFATGEDAVQSIVVGRGNRVVLVVVAAGARDRHAKHAASDDVDAVVDDVGLTVEVAAAECEESGRRRGRGISRLICRKLVDDELVVRQIGIKAVDDPIAIREGTFVVAILLEDIALSVGVAGDVEPVASPAFAEAWRRQEPVDGGFVMGVAGIGDECVEFFGGGRQADEVVVETSQQCTWRRLGRRGQFRSFQFRKHEAIDVTRAAAGLETGGGVTFCGCWYAQWSVRAGFLTAVSAGALSLRRSGAPIATHFTKSLMTASGSFPLGGISLDSYFSAEISGLSSGLLGTMTGPDSPPAFMNAAVSRRRPPFSFLASAEWQP